MADVPVLGFQIFSAEKQATLKSEYPVLLSKFPEEISVISVQNDR
jgi:hypothetical protein